MKYLNINSCKILYLLFILILNGCSLFHKNVDPSLPPITMEGKNTCGCIINGKIWVATEYSINTGSGGYTFPAVSGNFYKKKFLNIFAGNSFTFLIRKPSIKTFSLKDTSLVKVLYYNPLSYKNHCLYEPQIADGILIISKLDTINKIVSGTFEFRTIPQCGDTTNITQGRFDIGNLYF